jgi:hypothetical protein
MPSVFWLDPDYRDFTPRQTPLKFDTLYRGGTLDLGLVLFFSLSAAVLLVLVVALMVGMSEVNLLTLMLGVVIVGLLWVLRWGFREVQRYRRARRVFPRLQSEGVLLAGELTSIERRIISSSRLPSQHWIDVTYRFTTPDGRTLTGQQAWQREDLRKARLPKAGTPVRVLWAGEVAIVL